MSKILFVDDEMQFSAMLTEYLEEKDFSVVLKHSAADGLAAFKTVQFDCCIFDVKMPVKDGFSLAADVRAINENIPIIFLTGQSAKADRIKGLMIGADDYVTKPFSMEELYLRIRAILKRANNTVAKSVEKYFIGNYEFNTGSRELTVGEENFKLSAIESKLLQLLIENKNSIAQRDFILNEIWQDENSLKGGSLNVYISKLRIYLKHDDKLEILNAHGEGYQLVVKE